MFYFPIFFLAKQTSLSGSELFKENIIRSPCFFLFVCLWVYVPLENSSFIWRQKLQMKGFQCWPILGILDYWAVSQFLTVPHLLWHCFCVYNGHLRGSVTLASVPNDWNWNCHDLCKRLRSVATAVRIPISNKKGDSPTTEPPRRFVHVLTI